MPQPRPALWCSHDFSQMFGGNVVSFWQERSYSQEGGHTLLSNYWLLDSGPPPALFPVKSSPGISRWGREKPELRFLPTEELVSLEESSQGSVNLRDQISLPGGRNQWWVRPHCDQDCLAMPTSLLFSNSSDSKLCAKDLEDGIEGIVQWGPYLFLFLKWPYLMNSFLLSIVTCLCNRHSRD